MCFLIWIALCYGEPELVRFEASSEFAKHEFENEFTLHLSNDMFGLMKEQQILENDLIRYSLEVVGKGNADGKAKEFYRKTSVWFSTTPPYDLERSREVSTSGAFEKIVELTRVEGTTYEASITEGGDTRKLTIENIDYRLGDERWRSLWAKQSPKVGDKVRVRQYSVSTLLEFIDSAEIAELTSEGGTRGVAIKVLDEHEPEVYVHDFEGNLMRYDLGDFHAAPNHGGVEAEDLGSLNIDPWVRIKVDQPLGEGSKGVRLQVPPFIGTSVSNNQNQNIVYDKDNDVYLLTLQVNGFDPSEVKPNPTEITRRDDNEPQPDVLKHAREAIGDAVEPMEKVQRLLNYVSSYLTYDGDQENEPLTVADILKTRKGDCSQYSELFHSVANALDIPTKISYGYVYAGDEEQAFAGHAWCKVKINDRWHSVETTSGRFITESHYIEIDGSLPNKLGERSNRLIKVIASPKEIHQVGDHGTTLSLGPHWTKANLTPDLGDNQFKSSRDMFLAVFEDPSMALEFGMDLQIKAMYNSMSARAKTQAITISEANTTDGMTVVRAAFDASVSGIDLTYTIDMVSKDNLTYTILAWSKVGDKSELHREIGDLIDNMSFPSEDSAWVALNKPQDYKLIHRGITIRFPYAATRYDVHSTEGSDAAVTLTSKDGLSDGRIFMSSGYESVEEFEQTLNTYLQGEIEGLERIGSRPTTVSGFPGLIASYKSSDTHYESLIVAYRDDILEFRTNYDPEISDNRDFHHTFEHFAIEVPEQVDAFPTSSIPEEIEDQLTTAEKALIDESTVLGSVGFVPTRMFKTQSRLIAYNPRKVTAFDPKTKEFSTLHESETWTPQLVVVSRDGVRLLSEGAEAIALQDDHEQDGNATTIQLGRSHQLSLEYLNPTFEWGNGYSVYGSHTQSRLCITSHVKKHKYELVIIEPTHLIVSHDRKQVLSACIDKGSDKIQVWNSKSLQREMSLDWSVMESAVATDQGWLLTGKPKKGGHGVYLWRSNQPPSLLVSGHAFFGADYDSARGLVLVDRFNGSMVNVPPQVVMAKGAKTQPFHSNNINQIAQQSFDQAGLTTNDMGRWANHQALLVAANRIAQEEFSVPFPAYAHDYDRLCSDLYGDQPLSHQGLLLMSSLLTNIALQQGGIWLDGELTDLAQFGDYDAQGWSSCYSPYAIVWSVFFDDEGWWRPASTLLDTKRELVFSFDRQKLEHHMASRQIEINDVLASGDVATLGRLILENQSNTTIRQQVFASLNWSGNLTMFVELAESALPDLEEREAFDSIQLARAYLHNQKSEQAISELWSAIEKHSAEQLLYVMLAEAYESSSREQANDLARSCYLKAIELGLYDDELEQRIMTRLKRLDADPATTQ